ncbi:retrovirus-related Pol polyprotein from transposon 297 [Trichonephila clavipes]|uniref:Retrovirus-related Pol polyprotein from transposon 297 n=1 Tax=Trichonephila clavipes TaxID=2585209 RepID=A0A8X6W6Z5_TRICX|nr:retrovirus-related Pol polyprotein from transposon 297 [Trichonephila clavipes]
MGQCVQLWTRNYGALDQTARRQLRLDLVLYLLKHDGVSFKANKKEVLLEVAIDLGVEVNSTLTKSEIKNRICQSEDYNEESVKSLLEGILAEKREARELKERQETREYELERLRLSNATETVSVSSADLEGQGAIKEKVAEDRWVSQLIPLLPIEIAEIVAKEPLEKSDDYPHIKNLLLARFQLTPIALRDRFESHQRRPGAMWADLVFELRSYLDNWLAGMKVGDFAALKELLVTEQIKKKKRAPSELVDHFLDSWDGFKEAKSLAEKLDHFEAIRRVHKKTGPTKTWERRTFDKQPLESKNKSAHFSGKGKNIGPLNRDPYKHEVSQGSSQIRRECPRAGDNQFEKRKPIICYYCNETGHIKPVCLRLRKNNFETVANLTLNTGNYDPFKKFKMNMEINGIDRVCLRDSGSSIDVCSRSWINENDLLGEYVWLKSPLDEICHCLPLAKIKIKTKKGEFYTKAAIKQDSSDNDLYLLGNRTAELLESDEQGVHLVNAVVTRTSKYPEAIPVESITSPNVIDALLSIFSRIGFPREIQSDLGTSFTSELTTTFFNKFGIKVTRSSVSHPQSNAVERVHRTIKRVIKALCVESGEDWEGVLPLALFSLRTVAHESTGFSPTELVMGKNLRTPQTLVYEEWMEEGNTSQSVVEYILQLNNRLKRCQDIAITRMKECQLKRKTWYDRDAVERKFVEGDLIDELKQVITKNKDVFSPDPGTTHLMRMDIELISDKPIKTKPYRMSPRQINILREEIKRLLELGVIEIGQSDYTSPLILVESPNKDPRPCVDYRRLNKITRAEFFPLPNMEEIVEKVSAAPYVTVMDLSKGSFQIPLTPRAQRYAAFVTPFGTYIPKKMMFGLVCAPYYFCKLMAQVLEGLEQFALPYIDDIAIFSQGWKDHVKHIDIVLGRLRKAGLKVKPSKCKFAQEEVLFLGHRIGSGSRSPSDLKIKAIADFPRPTTKTHVRSFLGLVGYYSHYIPNYSTIASPLTDALRGKIKKEKITWDEKCGKAFEELKAKLVTQPILFAPDFATDFILQTDASEVGAGVVLSQIIEGEEHPIVFLSKKFSKAERNYSTVERELAAIIFGLKRLKHYLDGQKFIIETDHNPLRYLNKMGSTNPRLQRWALSLQPFNFEIKHKPGRLHGNADGLSRLE